MIIEKHRAGTVFASPVFFWLGSYGGLSGSLI